MTRRLAKLLSTAIVTLVMVLGVATPAAAVTREQKLAVMYDFTQISVGSYNYWYYAWLNQPAWAEYGFDWSTDLCSNSPDQPLGFDFRMPCRRHDWGYRNYRAIDLFAINKPRVDDAFYADLLRKCRTYNIFVRPACNSLARTYYEAVVSFGNLALGKADYDRAAQLKAEGEARAAAALDNL